MNISNLNNKIYGFKSLKQGEYANFMMETIEQQEIQKMNFNNYNNNDISNEFNEISKEIKF